MNQDMLNREDHLKSLALTVARNRVGLDEPINDVLLREGISPSDFDDILNDKTFGVYLKQFVTELKENGFSFAAKCRVLAEDAVADIYHLIKDIEAPAAARVKAMENIVLWSGLAAKSIADANPTQGFHITFNIPTIPAQQAAITIEEAAPTMEISFTTPRSAESLLEDADAYES
jgi:hypothetical protein